MNPTQKQFSLTGVSLNKANAYQVTVGSFVKNSRRLRIWALLAACAVLSTTSALAGFEGPYSLTPPPPGVYTNWQSPTNYGRWTSWGGLGTVNTSNAPNRLVLEVPAHSFFANSLILRHCAVADGTIGFDCATASTSSGYISWIKQPAGTNRNTYVPLDTGPAGQFRHFNFEVRTGDLFGFNLNSGSDAIHPGDPEVLTLTVENFVGPMPAPHLFMPSPGVICWQGESNLIYTVQTKINLGAPNWTPLGTAESSTTDFAFTNQSTAQQQFYRVVWP